jgi:hypothetical protein
MRIGVLTTSRITACNAARTRQLQQVASPRLFRAEAPAISTRRDALLCGGERTARPAERRGRALV